MCTAAVPSSASEALRMLPSLLRVLAGADPAGQPAEVLAEGLRMLEQADAVGAAVRGNHGLLSRDGLAPMLAPNTVKSYGDARVLRMRTA